MTKRIKDLWEKEAVARDKWLGAGGTLTGLLLAVSLSVFIFGGWIGNVYKLTQADFASPYKTEIIRGLGVPIGPLGAVIGWMDIGEEND